MAQGAFTLASAQTHDTGDPTKGSEHDKMLVNDEVNRFVTMTNGDAGSHVVTEVVYVSAANTLKKADADAAGTADGIAFATATVAAAAAGLYQTHGVLGGFVGLTAGAKYYVSATAGAITSTKPTTNPCFVGVAITTTELLIMPRGVLLVTTAEITDDAVTLAKLAHGTANKGIGFDGSGVPAEIAVSSVAVAVGTYTGDSTANRAIAHGLGVTPKYVTWVESGGQYVKMTNQDPGRIHYDRSGSKHVVTAETSTNFYVGNATNYTQSANLTATTYRWVAIG